jgi:hypothetical protein
MFKQALGATALALALIGAMATHTASATVRTDAPRQTNTSHDAAASGAHQTPAINLAEDGGGMGW